MISKKYLLTICLIVFVLFTISTAVATDANETTVAVEDNQIIEETNEETIVLEENEEPVINTNDNDEIISDVENDEIPLVKSDNNDVILTASDEAHTAKISFYKQTGEYTHNKKIYIKVTDAQTGKPLKARLTVYAYNYNSKPNDSNWKWFFFVDTNSNGIGVLKWSEYGDHGTYKIRVEGWFSSGQYAYDIDKNCKNLAKVRVYTKLSMKIKKEKGGLHVFLKLNKKPIKNIKLKVKIYTGKKYKTIYMTSGNVKKTKFKGYCAFVTNDLKVGKHKVVITSVNKNYKVSKTTSFKVTKAIKKESSLLAIISKGKLRLYTGF